MPSIIPGYEYDIFISYRQKDNKRDGWVSEFIDTLKDEIEATFKEDISIYFDANPHDGLHEHHEVDDSLREKLKCLIFIPIVSQTYCDPKCFAWEHEFKVFIEQARNEQFGLKTKLSGGNVASRVLPIKIHELDSEDVRLFELEVGGVLRSIDFIYSEPGVNRPLKPIDNEDKNLNKTNYRNQINKVANAIKEIILGIKNGGISESEPRATSTSMSRQKRQLAAIMFTDIQGYTALMQEDEEKAVKIRKRHREVFDSNTNKYNGKVLQYYGDGTLSIFDSAIEAVNCAIEMQLAFKQWPQIPVRIGVHLGDIIYDEEEVIGDGVNIASRVESLAVVGSVFISSKVYDEIKNQPSIRTQSIGYFEFKNVEQPIEVFAIKNEGLTVPTRDKLKAKDKKKDKHKSKQQSPRKIFSQIKIGLTAMGGLVILGFAYMFYENSSKKIEPEIHDKSIAVIPFKNMSSDEENQYFTDGQWDAIISHLSKIGDLKVLSRQTMEQYRLSKRTATQIAKELDVGYILEGSVQKYGDQVRIIVQLIEAEQDAHMWTEDYTRELEDIFSLQSEIAKQIAPELRAKLSSQEQEIIETIPTRNLEAYQYFLSGQNSYNGYVRTENSDLNEMAISQFQKALEIESGYALAWSGLSAAYRRRIKYGFGDSWLDSSALAARKAIKLDPKLGDPYLILGRIEFAYDNLEKALVHFNQVISLDPSNSSALYQLGKINIDRKDYKNGISQLVESFRLNPKSDTPENQGFYMDLAILYTGAGMLEEAEKLIRKQISLYPNVIHYLVLDAILWLQEKWEESKINIENIKERIEANPNPNIDHLNMLGFHYYWLGLFEEDEKNFEEAERIFNKSLQILKDNYEESYTFDADIRYSLAYIWLMHGKEEQAVELLKEDLEIMEQKLKAGYPHSESDLAHVHLLLGNKEECIRWINKMPYQGIMSKMIRMDPLFDEIRGEPRFQAKLAKFAREDEKIRNALQEIEIEGQMKWVLER